MKARKKASDILEQDYQLRKSRNHRYSKRSYAKLLGVSSGRLTDILSGRRPITPKKASEWADRLAISPEDQRLFKILVDNEERIRVDLRDKKKLTTDVLLDDDQFEVISDWQYFALMALVETSGFQSDIPWIAKKMSLSEERVTSVLKHLEHHKYISIDDQGRISNIHNSLATLTDIPSDVLQKANRDRVLLCLERMGDVNVLMRDVTSLSLPVDKTKMQEAKKLIRKFKGEMFDLLKGSNPSEVYNLNIQLVPLTDLEMT
jgi:uncharacterized protein (TIGR02147 family)